MNVDSEKPANTALNGATEAAIEIENDALRLETAFHGLWWLLPLLLEYSI